MRRGSYNHQNLVNYTNIGDRANALVHVRVPVTQGGNAVIAAYAVDGATILWSWHLWITDYVPARLSGTITAANREEAIRTAKSASAGARYIRTPETHGLMPRPELSSAR